MRLLIWTVDGWLEKRIDRGEEVEDFYVKMGSSRLLCTVNYVGITVVVFDPANMTKGGRYKTDENDGLET